MQLVRRNGRDKGIPVKGNGKRGAPVHDERFGLLRSGRERRGFAHHARTLAAVAHHIAPAAPGRIIASAVIQFNPVSPLLLGRIERERSYGAHEMSVNFPVALITNHFVASQSPAARAWGFAGKTVQRGL